MYDEEMDQISQRQFMGNGPTAQPNFQRPMSPGRALGGGHGGPEAMNRIPGVVEADARIHEGLMRLADRLGELEIRLQDVLRPGLDECGTATVPGQPAPLRAPLAERLHASAERIWSMSRALESILGRLEV